MVLAEIAAPEIAHPVGHLDFVGLDRFAGLVGFALVLVALVLVVLVVLPGRRPQAYHF